MDLTGVLVSAVSGVVGAAATALAATWRLASHFKGLTDRLDSVEKRIEDHEDGCDKFADEERRAWLKLERTLGRLEGAVGSGLPSDSEGR